MQCQSTEGKSITFHVRAQLKLTWGLPTFSLTVTGSWLPRGSADKLLVSPMTRVPDHPGQPNDKTRPSVSSNTFCIFFHFKYYYVIRVTNDFNFWTIGCPVLPSYLIYTFERPSGVKRPPSFSSESH